MDSLSINSAMINSLEQTIDQIVKQELAANKPNPAQIQARQKALDFNLEMSRVSSEMEQTQRQMVSADSQLTPDAKQRYVYWKTQMALLESQKPLTYDPQTDPQTMSL